MASIEKRKNKTKISYRVRYWSGRRNEVGKRLYDYSEWMDKRKDAQHFLEHLSLKKQKNSEFLTVNQAIDHMLDVCESIGRNGKKPVESSTILYYRDVTNRARNYNWGKSLHELEHEDIKHFRNWLLRTYSRDMARRTLAITSSAITEAIGHNKNPFIGISISVDKEPIKIPDKNDIKTLLEAANRLQNSSNLWIAKTWERYFPMIYLMYATGMRMQEFIAIPDFAVFQDKVKVVQALKRNNEIGKPKSKSGYRTIPIAKEFLEPTLWYIENKWIDNTHRLIFPTSSGKPISRENFRNKCWIPLMKEAGLGEEVLKENGKYRFVPKFTPHAMRHFFASVQIVNDRATNRLSVKRIQDLLGHANIQMTYDVYGHLLHDEDPEMDNLIRNTMKL